ncbi:MAG TPA: hypothetical protein VNI84_17290 [Pyrinomonadaceae bacterium]|nr:hypothetical protein [Pyrinomonadaceae bacterium]
MANDKAIITSSDYERALVLIPIVLEMGVEGARRFVLKNSLTDDQLIEKAREFQNDTRERNDQFAARLQKERDGF